MWRSRPAPPGGGKKQLPAETARTALLPSDTPADTPSDISQSPVRENAGWSSAWKVRSPPGRRRSGGWATKPVSLLVPLGVLVLLPSAVVVAVLLLYWCCRLF